MHTIKPVWLGLQPIENVLALQEKLFQKKYDGTRENFLLFAEHPHCFTYSHKPIETMLRVPLHEFQLLTIPAFQVKRGGSATYHGPGQLVAYWVIDFSTLKLGILEFSHLFGMAVLSTLQTIGLSAKLTPLNPALALLPNASGVWIGNKKIMSRGIRVSKACDHHTITTFGFALNVATDLSYFSYIYPCGLDIEMTSLAKEIGIIISCEEIIPLLLEALVNEFTKHKIAVEKLKPLRLHQSGF